MKADGRSLHHDTLEHIRKVAVARVKAGERPEGSPRLPTPEGHRDSICSLSKSPQ
jgi:hypothetical protein